MPQATLALSRIPVGESETHATTFHKLDDLDLAEPLRGQVRIDAVELGSWLAEFDLAGALQLECDRCLRQFNWPLELRFRALFSDHSELDDDDSWPVVNGQAELDEPVRQEVLLRIPMKKICDQNCPGISQDSDLTPKE